MIVAALLAAVIAHLPPPIRGDFDHDGRMDRAELQLQHGGRYRLLVWRGARPGRPETVDTDFDAASDIFLTKAKPGRWKTACGKGYGPDQVTCTRKFVRLTGDTIDFGVRESSEIVALWTGHRFEAVWISD